MKAIIVWSAVLKLFAWAQFRPFAVDGGLFFPIVPDGELPPVGWMRRHRAKYEDRYSPDFGNSAKYDGRRADPEPSGTGSAPAEGLTQILKGEKELENRLHLPSRMFSVSKQRFVSPMELQRLRVRQQRHEGGVDPSVVASKTVSKAYALLQAKR